MKQKDPVIQDGIEKVTRLIEGRTEGDMITYEEVTEVTGLDRDKEDMSKQRPIKYYTRPHGTFPAISLQTLHSAAQSGRLEAWRQEGCGCWMTTDAHVRNYLKIRRNRKARQA